MVNHDLCDVRMYVYGNVSIRNVCNIFCTAQYSHPSLVQHGWSVYRGFSQHVQCTRTVQHVLEEYVQHGVAICSIPAGNIANIYRLYTV